MATDTFIEPDEMVARALRADARQSDRAIARAVGCSHGHVAKLRRNLVAEGEIEDAPRHQPKPSDPIVRFAEPVLTETRWKPLRPHGDPFSMLERAERERDELFAQVQELRQEARS